MFWVPLAMAAGGALLGKKKYDRQSEIEDQTRKERAAQQQVSWASGRQDFTPVQYAGSQFGEVAGGALGGLGTGLSMGQAGMFSGSEGGLTGAGSATGALGGSEMASQMGAGSMYAKGLQTPQLQQAPSTLFGNAPAPQFGLGPMSYKRNAF